MEGTADTLIPLQLLAAEWGTTVEQLISELGDHRVITDALEVRFISVTDARELLAQRKTREAQRQQDQAAWRAALDAQGAPIRAKIAALQAHQKQLFATGQVDHNADAYAVMTCGENDRRLSSASRRMDGWLAGRSEGAMFNPQPARKD
jgi:hypothetical protein